MTKFFAIPETDNDSSLNLFSVKKTGKKVFIENLSDASERESKAIPAFFCFDSENLFFKNHDFPFTNKKRIEKIIDFELEPYFPVKNDPLEFEFLILHEKTDKAASKAFCLGLAESYMDENEVFLYEKNIEVSGFIPFSCHCANAFLNLGVYKDDCFVIVPGKAGNGVVFALSEKNILSAKKVSDISDEHKVSSAVSILGNFVSLSVKDTFSPLKIFVLDESGLKEKAVSKFSAEFGDTLSFFERNDLEEFLDFSADEKTGLLTVLCGYEILNENSLVFREKRPGLNKFFEQYKKEIIISGTLLIFSLSLLGMSTYFKFMELEKEYRNAFIQLEAAVKDNFPGIKKITPSVVDQAKIEIINARENFREGSNSSGIKKIVLLNSIISQIPSDFVELDNITILPVSTSLTGTASGYDVIDSVKNNLSDQSIISSVEIGMANTDSSGKVRFRLEIRVNE
ncbi:MAG: hypothetical protein AB7E04_06240 [Desulfobacteraceae bacterium]